MSSSSEATSRPEAETIITRAVSTFCEQAPQRPDGATLTAALLAWEKMSKRSRHVIPSARLLGRWQLCFSAGKGAKYKSGQPLGIGFYIPPIAVAHISLEKDETHPDQFNISNELRVGPLYVHFTGPARYLHNPKNLLSFDFTKIEVRCFGLCLYQGAIGTQKYESQSFADTAVAKLPCFSFFAATETYIAARGRGGGLAIWVKRNSME